MTISMVFFGTVTTKCRIVRIKNAIMVDGCVSDEKTMKFNNGIDRVVEPLKNCTVSFTSLFVVSFIVEGLWLPSAN